MVRQEKTLAEQNFRLPQPRRTLFLSQQQIIWSLHVPMRVQSMVEPFLLEQPIYFQSYRPHVHSQAQPLHLHASPILKHHFTLSIHTNIKQCCVSVSCVVLCVQTFAGETWNRTHSQYCIPTNFTLYTGQLYSCCTHIFAAGAPVAEFFFSSRFIQSD